MCIGQYWLGSSKLILAAAIIQIIECVAVIVLYNILSSKLSVKLRSWYITV